MNERFKISPVVGAKVGHVVAEAALRGGLDDFPVLRFQVCIIKHEVHKYALY
jgi:hypothetical protein